MDVSEVHGAADTTLVSEALKIIWGILDDLIDRADVSRAEYEDDLARLDQLAHLLL